MVKRGDLKGYVCALLSYLIWGVLPLYWHLVDAIPSAELLFLRIISTFVTLLIWIYVTKNIKYKEYLRDKKLRNLLILSSLFLAINWGAFLFSVSIGKVIQASLGYYINPLVSVCFGVFILKEKLTKIQIAAVFITLIGVIYMGVNLDEFPYISLILAFSFALYGLIKKGIKRDTYNTVMIEISFLFPIAVIYNIYLIITNTITIINMNLLVIILIVFTGIITAVPLILFNESAKRIPLVSIGILQYFAPTLMLLISVLVFGE